MLKFIFVVFLTINLVNCIMVKDVGDFILNRKFEPNSTFQITVVSYPHVKPIPTNLTLTIRRGDVHVSKDIVVQPASTETHDLEIGDFPVGEYGLFVENHEDSSTKEIAMMVCEFRKVKMVLGIFMPFWYQDSNISVIVHQLHSRSGMVVPLNRDDFKISVTDPTNTAHEIEPDQIDSSGKNFMLVYYGVQNKSVGEYVMKVNYNDSINEIKFNVKERNLNSFTIHLDPYIHNDTNGNPEMVIDIRTSKLTGEIFEGHGFVLLNYNNNPFRMYTTMRIKVPEFREKTQVRTNLRIDEINLKDTLFSVDAEITEKTHGQSMKSPMVHVNTRNLFESSANYVLHHYNSTFTPGIPFIVLVFLKSQTQVPIYDEKNPITVTYKFGEETNEEFHKEIIPTSLSGSYDFVIDVPENVETIKYTIKYKDLKKSEQYQFKILDPFIQVRFINTTTVEVTSNEMMSSVTYVVLWIGYNEVDQIKTIPVSPPSKLVTFHLKNMHKMSPKSVLMVKYFSESHHKLIERPVQIPVNQLCNVEHTGNIGTYRKIVDFHKPMEISIKCDFHTKMIIKVIDENPYATDRNPLNGLTDINNLPELSKYLPRSLVLDISPSKTTYEIGTVPPEWNTITVDAMRNDDYGFFEKVRLVFEAKDLSSTRIS